MFWEHEEGRILRANLPRTRPSVLVAHEAADSVARIAPAPPQFGVLGAPPPKRPPEAPPTAHPPPNSGVGHTAAVRLEVRSETPLQPEGYPRLR
ncbi:MAG: hypothetical protein KatS3mg065_0160 [Chloroflexota bacterium]|nr:MAG: hypothetical protein KatS3mg065_0160 [Chloroflexota bacterium]